MKKGGNRMRAKYSVTHYETYSKTVLDVLDEFFAGYIARASATRKTLANYLASAHTKLENYSDWKICQMKKSKK